VPDTTVGQRFGTVTLHACAAGTVTIDWTAIAANTRLLADHAHGELMAVVKADGFGHGSVEVATTALANGATRLGVTCLAEALPLREAAGLGAAPPRTDPPAGRSTRGGAARATLETPPASPSVASR